MINQNYLFHIFLTTSKGCNSKKRLVSNLRICNLLNFLKNIDETCYMLIKLSST